MWKRHNIRWRLTPFIGEEAFSFSMSWSGSTGTFRDPIQIYKGDFFCEKEEDIPENEVDFVSCKIWHIID